jgi:hypothetical protein
VSCPYAIYIAQVEFSDFPISKPIKLNPKLQNSNLKQISKYNDQNSKLGIPFAEWGIGYFFGISNLDIVCYLFFGACNFINHGRNC